MYSRGSKSPLPSDSIAALIKATVGAGIVLMAAGLVLFVNDALSRMAMSVYLQLAVDGLIVIGMSFFAIKVWRRLEHV